MTSDAPQAPWEGDSRRELKQAITACRTLSARVKAMGALAKCSGKEERFFDPAQQAAERLDQAANILDEFIREGPDKSAKVVSNCVSRLMRTIGFSSESREEVVAKESAPSYDAGEFNGHSRAISVPEILEFLSLMNKTGVLTVATKHENFTLELEKGQVVHAHSDSSPKGERLGEILVAQGSLKQSQLDEFLTGARAGSKLGQALRDERIVSRRSIGRALSYQIQQLFTRLFQAEEAYFVFREGAPANDDSGLRMNVTGLLLESASTLDEFAANIEDRKNIAAAE